MATRNEKKTRNGKELVAPRKTESGSIAKAGIRTSHDFGRFMSALISDIVQGTLAPNVANAAVNAGGKLLKIKEMELKYGKPTGGERVLTLAAAPVE